MRGNFKEAEELCLAILHQFPHNLSANILMGDIATEQGALDQAVEWYELALDIEPDNASLKAKLEAAQSKKEDSTTQSIVQELGLPPEKPKTVTIAITSIVGILAMALLAWFAYKAASRTRDDGGLDKPVVITTGGGGGVSTTGNTDTTGGNEKPNQAPSSEEDATLTKLIASKATESAFFVDARFDLMSDGITITYNAPQDKDEREIGVKLATESFGIVKDGMSREIRQVTLRALRDKKVFYTAIVKKDAYEATQTSDWQDAHKDDPQALLKAVLSNEKRAGTSQEDTAGTTGSETDAGTTGTTGEGNATGATDTTGAGSTGAATTGSAGATGTPTETTTAGTPPQTPDSGSKPSGG
jgi:hypothetical protein